MSLSLEKNILYHLNRLDHDSHVVYESYESDEDDEDRNDNSEENDKKIIQQITQILALKKLFCHSYLQNKYIEYRTYEYPFKSFRYYIRYKK